MKSQRRILVRLTFLTFCFVGGIAWFNIALHVWPAQGHYLLPSALGLLIASLEATFWLLGAVQRQTGFIFFFSGFGLYVLVICGLMLALILVPIRLMVLFSEYVMHSDTRVESRSKSNTSRKDPP